MSHHIFSSKIAGIPSRPAAELADSLFMLRITYSSVNSIYLKMPIPIETTTSIAWCGPTIFDLQNGSNEFALAY